ncbi:MAG: hypothetical protein AAGC77_11195 [Pseudomonadota bacterium]
MLAAENWRVKVEGKIYGPYTPRQMHAFAQQGRLAPWSLISPDGAEKWREAIHETTFMGAFGLSGAAHKKAIARTFGKRETSKDTAPAENAAKPASLSSSTVERSTPPVDTQHGALAQFVVVFDVVNAAATRIEPAIRNLGHAFRLADNVWNVTTSLTAIGVRNVLAPHLYKHESIFVVDAKRGRTSWQNYAPEVHAKITAEYVKPQMRQ